MSTPKDDGGAAFPCGSYDPKTGCVQVPVIPGMSLRDWFAGQALSGQLANSNWPNVGGGKLPASEEKCAAHWSYNFADAMLAARKETT